MLSAICPWLIPSAAGNLTAPCCGIYPVDFFGHPFTMRPALLIVLFVGTSFACTSNSQCNGHPCEEGACECEPPWEGRFCQFNTETGTSVGNSNGAAGGAGGASASPCATNNNMCGSNGQCVPTTGGYVCECNEGWEGANCDVTEGAAAMCSLNNPCQFGGTCNDEGECDCPFGYLGDFCERAPAPTTPVMTNPSATVPVNPQNPATVTSGPVNPNTNPATVTSGPVNPVTASSGPPGPVNPQNTNPATVTSAPVNPVNTTTLCLGNKPCYNGGACDGPDCACVPGKFWGPNCQWPYVGLVPSSYVEPQPNPCKPNPCLNLGVCMVENGRAVCRCEESHRGEFCEDGPVCQSEESCFECMCGTESNENARGCSSEHGPDEMCAHVNMTGSGACNRRDLLSGIRQGPCLCGSLQISEAYYTECSTGTDGNGVSYDMTRYVPASSDPLVTKDWVKCALNQTCARQCMKNYVNKLSEEFLSKTYYTISCKDRWRIHRNGHRLRNGENATLVMDDVAHRESGLDACCTSPALGCATDVTCLKFLCGMASSDAPFRCGGEYGHAPWACSDVRCNQLLPKEFSNPNEPCVCGHYQTSEAYWNECKEGLFYQDWPTCSADEGCATQCVDNYIKRHMFNCTGINNYAQLTCEQKAFTHRRGSKCDPQIPYSTKLQQLGTADKLYLDGINLLCDTAIKPSHLGSQGA